MSLRTEGGDFAFFRGCSSSESVDNSTFYTNTNAKAIRLTGECISFRRPVKLENTHKAVTIIGSSRISVFRLTDLPVFRFDGVFSFFDELGDFLVGVFFFF